MSAPATPGPSGSVAWDSTPTRRALPGALTTLALLALVPAVVSTALRLIGPTDDAWALVASFIPYGQLGYPVALVLLLAAQVGARRRGPLRLLALAVAGLIALHLTWLVPFFVPDERPVVGPELTLLSQNVYNGEVDVAQLTAAAVDVDLVVLNETTPAFLAQLQTPGWNEEFPYALGDEASAPADTTVFSRYPLSQSTASGHHDFEQWVTTVAVPGRTPVRLIAAHPCNPYCGGGLFASDHAPLVRLRADGLRSTTDLVGAGFVPTWPANRSFPPLFAIDHVLVDDQLTATSLRTVHLAGTDHLGLVVTLAGTR